MSNPTIESFHLEQAGKRVNNVYDSMIKRNSESFKFSYSFYQHISLLAGGVISLSITFIGYLLSIEDFNLMLPHILIASWVFLLFAIFFSIYRNYYHDFFIHFQLQRKFTEAKIAEADAIIHATTYEPFIFAEIHTTNDQKSRIEDSNKDKIAYQKAREKNEAEEKKYKKIWVWTQRGAHFSFIMGMTLMVLFAALNIPVSPSQNAKVQLELLPSQVLPVTQKISITASIAPSLPYSTTTPHEQIPGKSD